MAEPPPICQIALSVRSVRRAQRWYRDVLGLAPAGGTNLFVGPLASMVQGVPHAASTCWWLVDRQDFFQLEFFEFRGRRARPADRRPCDIGYASIGVHVAEFDAVLSAARSAGSPALADPIGPEGARRACVHDPDGTLIELLEDDPRSPHQRARPRADVPAVVRSVTLSVPDLGAALRRFERAFGLGPATAEPLHDAQHEAVWGLEGATSRRALLWAGDIGVELAQYESPMGRPQPQDHRVDDIGISHVAFGLRRGRDWRAQLTRCRDAGLQDVGRPLRAGVGSVVYLGDADGFTIELLRIPRWFDAALGFAPRRTPRFAPLATRDDN